VKFVLTNDDGYDAAGLAALRAVVEPWGGELWMVAPLEPQSYMGHRVTTMDEISVEQTGPREYRVGGTPADCARIALRCLVPDADWLFSGINHGGNLGVDVYISGTVAAAREAALLGCPGIAISHYRARGREFDWPLAQRRLAPVLRSLIDTKRPTADYWNINLPQPPEGAPEPELQHCVLDRRPLDVRFRRGEAGYVYAGTYQGRPFEPDTDVAHCFAGRITLTSLHL